MPPIHAWGRAESLCGRHPTHALFGKGPHPVRYGLGPGDRSLCSLDNPLAARITRTKDRRVCAEAIRRLARRDVETEVAQNPGMAGHHARAQTMTTRSRSDGPLRVLRTLWVPFGLVLAVRPGASSPLGRCAVRLSTIKNAAPGRRLVRGLR